MLLPPRFQQAADVVLALLLAAVAVAEIWVPFASPMGEGSNEWSTLVVLVMCLATAFRRRWPLATALVVFLAWPLGDLVAPVQVLFWGALVPIVVALYSVARFGRGRHGWYGGGALVLAMGYLDLTVAELQNASEIVFHWMVLTAAFTLGRVVNVMERRARESTQRAVDAEVAAVELTMAAVVEERTRIARELHDVVAHSVSMMVVQAGAAEQVVDDDPAFVRAALGAIRTTGTGALGEMRRVVTMLRSGEETGSLVPQPGVAALPALVEDARRGGLEVSLDVEGEQRALPAGLDLAAYRIVQEALTNVRRHASARSARVLLRYLPERLELEVRDDGRGLADGVPARGHGLIGMRERAALYGGRLETTSAGGGFTVRAVLPVATS